MRKSKMKMCVNHGLTEFGERGKEGAIHWRCKKCSYDAVKRRRRKLKQELVKYKGGQCKNCGYKKSLKALEFHHRDPSKKDLKLTVNIALRRLKKEADKCDLLCANCHREEHERLYELNSAA